MKKFYAEWEKQDGIMLAFPHKDSDWNEYLEEAREVYCQIIYEISKIETCILLCQNKIETKAFLKQQAKTHKWDLNLKNLYLIEMPTNDTWARDFGGITICKNNRIWCKQINSCEFSSHPLTFTPIF